MGVVQGDPGVGHRADPQQPDHLVRTAAAAIIAASLGLGKQADLVVVTDRARCDADERSRITDADRRGGMKDDDMSGPSSGGRVQVHRTT